MLIAHWVGTTNPCLRGPELCCFMPRGTRARLLFPSIATHITVSPEEKSGPFVCTGEAPCYPDATYQCHTVQAPMGHTMPDCLSSREGTCTKSHII